MIAAGPAHARVIAAGGELWKLAAPGAMPGALAREARALARLGPPWTPALLGWRSVGGEPALALERLDGVAWSVALRGRADDAAARALVEAVAALHARGVIHGDLSGANVMQLRDGSLRLLDLGESLCEGDAPSGPPAVTAAYGAPELLAGAPPTRRSDVYALGALLFELYAGRPPFVGSTAAIRQSHRRRRAPRLAQHAAVSRELDALVAACLAKAPGSRPADAIEVAARWRMFAGSSALGSAVPAKLAAVPAGVTPTFEGPLPSTVPADAAAAVPVELAPVRELPFVGRERELAALRAGLDDAAAGAAIGVLVLGEPGVGTSRLLAALAAGGSRLHIIDGDGERAIEAIVAAAGRVGDVAAGGDGDVAAAGAGVAAWTWLATVAAPVECAALRLAAGVRGVATAAADDRAATGGADDGGADDAALLEPLRAAPGALRHAAVRALTAALLAAGRQRGLALAIDHAGRAEPVVIDAVERALATEGARGLWLALAGGAELVRRRAKRPVSPAAVWRVVEVPALDPVAGRALAAAALPACRAVPQVVLDRIVELSGGVPRWIGELCGAFQRAGAVRRGTDGALRWLAATAEGSVVERLDRLVARDLGRMAASLRAHAWAHAVIADDGDVARTAAVVERVAAADPVALPLDHRAAVRSLTACGLLRDDGERAPFRNAAVRDAVVRAVPPELARAFHRAALVEACVSGAAPEILARHAEGAGAYAAAAQAWLRAAVTCAARHDYLRGEHAADRACAAADRASASAERREALRWRATLRARLGRHDEACADFAAVRAAARACGDVTAELDAILDEATARDWARDDASAAALTTAAMALDIAGAGVSREARRALAVGRAAWRAGDERAAIEHLERVLVALDGAPHDESYETRIAARLMLGFLLPEHGQLERAEALLEEAGAEARARGDRLHEAAALNNRLAIARARARPEDAIDGLREVIAIGRELGMLAVEYRGRVNRALMLVRIDRDAEALGDLAPAAELDRALPALFPVPRATLGMARLAVRAGDLARGARLLDDADRLLAAGGGTWGTFDADLREELGRAVATQRGAGAVYAGPA